MKRSLPLFAPVLLVLLVSAFVVGDATAPTADTAVIAPPAAYRVHIDPATGAYTAPDHGVEFDMSKAISDALNTSHEGLFIEDSPVKDGGIMVDLQGRFQHGMLMTINKSGERSFPCMTGSPEQLHQNHNH